VESSVGQSTPRFRVLLVDDALDELDMYQMALEDAGYTIVPATRGHTGYGAAVNEQPDVIVLDLMLPDVDGWIVCAWLKANPTTATIPVIILTARNDYDIPLRALHANVYDLLHKPCSVDRLVAAIEGALGHRGRPFKKTPT
jgi:DNA-binding response OmpR family regulator